MRRLAACLLVLACALAGPCVAQSLFREEAWRPLTSDQKALRPGDVLTVQVLENSSAVTSADTDTRRNNRLQADLAHGGTPVAQATLDANGSFGGGGRTQRVNRVLAMVTVTVQEVLPGGQLRIAGQQAITVNDEAQTVRLEGLVRPVDISEGNVVASSRIADARITYVGSGDLTERGRRAWWRRLLDAIGF